MFRVGMSTGSSLLFVIVPVFILATMIFQVVVIIKRLRHSSGKDDADNMMDMMDAASDRLDSMMKRRGWNAPDHGWNAPDDTAKPVRCESCGATIEAGELKCNYCGAPRPTS